MEQVTIYTDGACSGNPGVGGWGAILIHANGSKEIYGGDVFTTNNKMELTAAIEALQALKVPCYVDLYTDSKYVVQGITDWIYDWKRKNWHIGGKKPVANVELWKRLDSARWRHHVKWHWVKGHAGNHYNEIADELARRGIKDVRCGT